jgi:hypothetical protein
VLDFYANDHKPLFPLPLWMQINTDIDGVKLEQIVRG